MRAAKEIFFATGNPHKLREAAAVLGGLGLEILGVDSFPGFASPEETGRTLLENARLKAHSGLACTGIPTFAEDAGLEVAALDGEPGVFSARYLGDVPQEEKNRDIIRRLDAVSPDRREACFHSVVVCCWREGDEIVEIVAEGFCHGKISTAPRGREGFGYDPIFLVPELGKTLAELPPEAKNRISHRANALESLKRRILLYREHG